MPSTEDEIRKRVLGVFDTLTDRERIVIWDRFGLDGLPIKTLRQIGSELGVTRERVRQIQGKALIKIKLKLIREKRDALS